MVHVLTMHEKLDPSFILLFLLDTHHTKTHEHTQIYCCGGITPRRLHFYRRDHVNVSEQTFTLSPSFSLLGLGFFVVIKP